MIYQSNVDWYQLKGNKHLTQQRISGSGRVQHLVAYTRHRRILLSYKEDALKHVSPAIAAGQIPFLRIASPGDACSPAQDLKTLFATHCSGQRDNRSTILDSKVHGANMRPIWGRQDPGGPHVGPMKFAIWDVPSVTKPMGAFKYDSY